MNISTSLNPRKIILSILFITTMVVSGYAQIPTADLVGQYDFTNGTLTDNINSSDFTKTGTASTNITDRFGNANAAISLNGDDLIRPDIDFNLSTSNPYLERTISFWVKTSTNDGNVRLIYNDNNRTSIGATSFEGLIVYLQNGQVKASNRSGLNGNLITHSVAVDDNNWHHVVVQGYSTSISGTKRFYTYVFIDSVKEGGNGYQTSSSNVSVTANEYIGNLGFSRLANVSLTSNQKYLDGLDEVLFYTRILTDMEVGAITSNGFCTVSIPDVNFKSYLVGNATINTNGDSEIQCSEATAFNGGIYASGNFINDLTGIEAFTALTYLACDGNNLISLDISNNTALTSLFCESNALTTLDVTNNINLIQITTTDNNLTNLDLTNNINLTYLDCGDNPITNLDLTINTALNSFQCYNSSLTSLNVANGNNINFTTFYTIGSPNLTCIQVDDVAYSTTNWSDIDPTSNFSINCTGTVLVSSIVVQGQGGASTITTQGGTLQMEATVLPANADDGTYTWSVVNGTGSASIDAAGILTALTDGIVDVIATANDASGETGTATITISNQSVGLNKINSISISTYPNPVKDKLFVEVTNEIIKEINVIDHSGRTVKSIMSKNATSIDVSDLTKGIYLLKVSTDNGVATTRFIKQ